MQQSIAYPIQGTIEFYNFDDGRVGYLMTFRGVPGMPEMDENMVKNTKNALTLFNSDQTDPLLGVLTVGVKSDAIR
jgi:hypothetical protein